MTSKAINHATDVDYEFQPHRHRQFNAIASGTENQANGFTYYRALSASTVPPRS